MTDEIATPKSDPLICQLGSCDASAVALREVEGEFLPENPVYEVSCAKGHVVQVVIGDDPAILATWTMYYEEGILPDQ